MVQDLEERKAGKTSFLNLVPLIHSDRMARSLEMRKGDFWTKFLLCCESTPTPGLGEGI